MRFLRRLFYRLTGVLSFAPVDAERLRLQRLLASALVASPRKLPKLRPPAGKLRPRA